MFFVFPICELIITSSYANGKSTLSNGNHNGTDSIHKPTNAVSETKSEISLNLTKSKIDQKHFFPQIEAKRKVLPLHKPQKAPLELIPVRMTKMSYRATSFI